MDISNLFRKFKDALEKIIAVSGGNDQTGANLIDATYLNFVALAGNDPTIKPLLGPTGDHPLSAEEFETKVKEFQTVTQANGFDFTGKFREAIKQTLDDYVSGIEPSIAPEKTAQLRKIVSEEI